VLAPSILHHLWWLRIVRMRMGGTTALH